MEKESNYYLFLAGVINESKYLENEESERAEADHHDDHEFKSWLSKFDTKFPSDHHDNLSKEDQHNLYIGRIMAVLEELGLIDKWPEYAGMSNLQEIVNNYQKLLVELVRRNHPAMFDSYKKWHDIY